MSTAYETDVIAWAEEQAALLRTGRFSEIDIENIAEEILDVGKSEKHRIGSRMATLLAQLLKWQYQSEKRSRSWTNTIKEQRTRVLLCLKETPSLKVSLQNDDWWTETWLGAKAQARKETGLDDFPEFCPWSVEDIFTEGWLPID